LDRYPGGGLIIVNNESIMKSLVKYLLAGIALLSGSFVEVSAQDSTGEDKFVVNKKSAEYDYSTRMGTLTLESYVTGYVKQTRVAVPADICLVLDFSDSMEGKIGSGDNRKAKSELLITAATKFINDIAQSATNNGVTHRISLVKFATVADVLYDWTEVNTTDKQSNVKSLIAAVESIRTKANLSNTTRYDMAFSVIKNVMYGGSNLVAGQTPKSYSSGGYAEYNTRGKYISDGFPNRTFSIDGTQSDVIKKNLVGMSSQSSTFLIFLTDGTPTDAGYTIQDIAANLDYKMSQCIDVPGIKKDEPGTSMSSSDTYYDKMRYGQTGSSGYGGTNSNYYRYEQYNIAIDYAKELKSKGVTIFSIFVGDTYPAEEKLRTLCTDGMEAISSKYPDASRYRLCYHGTATTDTTHFFQWVKDNSSASSLSIAFTHIFSSIEEVISAKYGKETLMKDFINNAYFSLPSSISADADPWSYIRVFDVKCTGVGADGKTREFETTRHHEYSKTGTTSTDTITIVVNRATSSHPNDEIIIYGFSYSNNWCGTNNGTPHGYKLEVEVPFEFTGGTTVPGEVMTNAEGSGIYPAEQDENGNVIYDPVTGLPVYDDDPDEPYTPPTITFCTLEIVREGLDRGESAIYEITCNGVSVGRVSLNGTDDPSVSKTLYGLPGGNYTVTETNWNWAYNHKIEGGSSPNPCSITKKVDDPKSIVTFTFSGEHKTGTGPEDMHNHDEEYKVNIIDVSTFPSPKASPLRKEEDYLFE